MVMPHEVHYLFRFIGGRSEEFRLRFDESFDLIRPGGELPEWTRLGFHCCANCPLDPATHTHCPLAAALADPVLRFGNVVSYEALRVEVVTEERTIAQDTTAQEGIRSLLGLINATSGCPVTAYFKPMARFHLPFASEEETIYRAASMYLLGEYFRQQELGGPPDMHLEGLLSIYREIEQVNRGIVARIRASRTEDSALNAIVLLDLFAKSLPYAVEESLGELRYLYEAYLGQR